MTTGAEHKAELTLKDKVDILRSHGFDLISWYGPEVNDRGSVIFFRGGDDEGHRATKVMREHGIAVDQIIRKWVYCDDGEGNDCVVERWGILFNEDRTGRPV